MYNTDDDSDGYRLVTGSPESFPSSMLDTYAELLEKGGAVRVNKNLLSQAWRWSAVIHTVTNKLLAAGALKQTNVNEAYYRRVFGTEKASLTQKFNTSNYRFDLGYIVTDSDFQGRGYCDMIIGSLLEQSALHGVLATTQDLKIKNKLKRNGFEHKGNEWEADNGGRLSLYLRSARNK